MDENKPMFPAVYFENSELNEDITFMNVIKDYVAVHDKERPLFVFDRGLKSQHAYQTLPTCWMFIIKTKTNTCNYTSMSSVTSTTDDT